MNTTNVCIELLGFYVFASQAIVNNWISGGPSTAEAPKFFLGCLALARALRARMNNIDIYYLKNHFVHSFFLR